MIRFSLILDTVHNPEYNDSVLEDAKGLLREHGLQVTAQRLAVLEAVSARPHASADQLADDVRGSIGSVSRQAV